MLPLSQSARAILDRMEYGRPYDAQDVLDFCPDAGLEHVQEAMHELWVHRQVERVGYAGWRRQRSAPPHAPTPAAADNKAVKPEELFDHSTFAEFFE